MDTWRVNFNLVTLTKLSRSLLISLKRPSYTGLEFQMVGSEGSRRASIFSENYIYIYMIRVLLITC